MGQTDSGSFTAAARDGRHAWASLVAVFAAATMFNFFKRSSPKPVKARAKPATRQTSRPKDVPPSSSEDLSLPEVIEGNDHTDWAMWEDSVMVLDSQMQGLTPSARIYERDKQTSSEFQDIDPFARIGKKSA